MPDDWTETGVIDPDDLPAGRVADGVVLHGRYRLDSEVGRGGMGVVFRATDLQLGREVAIKVLPGAAASADARARLVQEARAAAALNHPHIVTVHDVGEDRGVPFLVMELVPGRTLRGERIATPAEIVGVAAQICDALAHAHASGIVHRDIKPENVLVVGDGAQRTIKVTDLGVAMPIRDGRRHQARAVVGTAAYIAPEQALGEPVDGRADLYALGAVVYEMAVGRPPFQADEPLGVISQHVNAPVVPPRTYRPDLPSALEAVILRLLAKNPTDRYESADVARAALQQALTISSSGIAGAGSPSVVMLDALSRGRMVGRDNDLATARDLWRRARHSHGHGLLVSGEPGVGKTRLARELMIEAGLDGATVLWGACYEFDAVTPYLPFGEAIRRWARTQPDATSVVALLGDRLRHVAKLVPDLALPAARASGGELAPHEERLLFADAVVFLFRTLAADRGLLFYVDDLQWADAATLWLLAHVLRQLADGPVLVVASYRESELDRTHPLAKALVEWNRERLTTRLALKRLAPEGTRAQLAALLGEDPGTELAAALHQETDGNPFFVEEILKALIEQGSVARKAQGWVHCDIGDLQLPQSVKAAIGRRLDRVSAETNDVLRAAAVLGKQFGFAELAEAAGATSEDALLNALDEAVAAQLLVTGRHETFAFTHDKIREVLYEELNPIRRRRLHLRTAEGLERCRDRAAVSVDRLAHHFIEAGAHERGLAYARQAAADARRVFAYDEAVAACARAYECAEALGRVDEQLALQEEMGQLCRVAGNTVAALDHFERALALATDPVTRARLQCDAATSLVVNGDPRGLEYVQRARAVLDPARHPIETANALVVEGRFHHLAGRHSVAADRLLEAVALLERRVAEMADDEAITALVLACMYLGGACQHLGLFDDGDRWARKAIEVGVTYGRPAAEANGYEILSENACISGRWQESLALVTTGRAIGERLHSRERLAWSYLPTALSYVALGDPVRAEEEFESGIALALAVGERRLAVMLQATRPIAVADQGRLDESLRLATEAIDAADRLGLVFLETEARRGLAHVHGTRGDWDAAIAMYDEVLRLVGDGEPAVTRLLMGASHVRALKAAGRLDDARAELARFEQLAARCQSRVAVRQVEELTKELAVS